MLLDIVTILDLVIELILTKHIWPHQTYLASPSIFYIIKPTYLDDKNKTLNVVELLHIDDTVGAIVISDGDLYICTIGYMSCLSVCSSVIILLSKCSQY